jgi:hypothetical protein
MNQAINTEKLKSVFQDFLKNLNKGKRKSANPETYGFTESSFDSAPIPAPQQASSFPQFIVKFTRFLLFMVIGTLAFANIKPYISICSAIGAGLGDPIYQSLSKLPVLSWIMSLGSGTIAFICGLCLWALLQSLQLLPKIILDDADAILVLMSWVSRFKAVAFKSDDSALLVQLKQRFNNLPLEWIESMQFARAMAYVIDGILVFWFYPPIVGGYDRVDVFLTAPSFKDIDWNNLIAAIATMFAVEVLYDVGKILTRSLSLLSDSRRTI